MLLRVRWFGFIYSGSDLVRHPKNSRPNRPEDRAAIVGRYHSKRNQRKTRGNKVSPLLYASLRKTNRKNLAGYVTLVTPAPALAAEIGHGERGDLFGHGDRASC